MKKTLYFSYFFFLSSLYWGCQSPKAVESADAPLGWKQLETPVTNSLRGLSPLTEEIAWASGSEGLWMMTLDGGATWRHGVIDGLDTVDFRDIEGFDAKTAIAVSAGQPAVIYKTKDAGKSWEKTYQGPEEAFLDGLVFMNDKKGYAYGDPVAGKWMVLKTLDGGDTWIALNSAPKASEGEAGFAASGTGILASGPKVWMASGGKKSRIFYSTDGGIHWEVYDTPMQQGMASQGIFSLAQIGEHGMIGVGGDYLNPDQTEGNAMISNDGGVSWGLPSGTPPSGYRSGVAYFPRHHWVITVGPNGSDFSKDAGKNWIKFSEEAYHAVQLSKNDGTVWASGPVGKVAVLNY